MLVPSTLRDLDLEGAIATLGSGGALVDLRPLEPYLEAHIPGSLPLVYEFGPGMQSRARDCVPLSVPLVLLDPGDVDTSNAAAALRGKGFTVIGRVVDALNQWTESRGTLASTEVSDDAAPPEGQVLDIGDPGAPSPPGAWKVPVEQLWARAAEPVEGRRLVVAGGYGVRAALALGILEHAGAERPMLWRPG